MQMGKSDSSYIYIFLCVKRTCISRLDTFAEVNLMRCEWNFEVFFSSFLLLRANCSHSHCLTLAQLCCGNLDIWSHTHVNGPSIQVMVNRRWKSKTDLADENYHCVDLVAWVGLDRIAHFTQPFSFFCLLIQIGDNLTITYRSVGKKNQFLWTGPSNRSVCFFLLVWFHLGFLYLVLSRRFRKSVRCPTQIAWQNCSHVEEKRRRKHVTAN